MTDFVLSTTSLFSKWGFEDGSVFSNVLEDAGLEPYWPSIVNPRHVLVQVVCRRMLPLIKRPLRVLIMNGTGHNPIRIRRVGDLDTTGCEYEPVCGHDPYHGIELKEISVSAGTVIEIARRCIGKEFRCAPGPDSDIPNLRGVDFGW